MDRLEKMSDDKAMGHMQPKAMRKNVQEHYQGGTSEVEIKGKAVSEQSM